MQRCNALAPYDINFVVLSNDKGMKSQIAIGIAKALNTYGICDKNKIGKIGVPRISGLDGIDCFITDAQLTDEWQVALAEQDVKLVEVEK